MAKVIAIVNQKGGVAKSTSCVNLGIGLVKKGYKVLAIDFDPQGSLRAAETSAEGVSIYKHDPKGRVAEAYKKLVEEVIDDGSERE